MKYYVSNGVKIIECAPSEFKLVMVNRPKKNLGKSTYVNANFFASGRQNGRHLLLSISKMESQQSQILPQFARP